MCTRVYNSSVMFTEEKANGTHCDSLTLGLPPQHYSQEKIDKARKAGKYLQLLVHSQECKGTECPNTVMCRNAKLLMNHCASCKSRESCPIAGCQQTKTLLHHLTICRWERKNARLYGTPVKECLICYFMGGGDDPTKNGLGLDVDGFPVPQPPKRFRSASEEYADKMGYLHHRGTGRRSHSVTDAGSFSMCTSVMEEAEEEPQERGSGGRYRSVSTSNIIPSFCEQIDSSSSSDSFSPLSRGEFEGDNGASLFDGRERSVSAADYPSTRPFGMHGNQEVSPPCPSVVPVGGVEVCGRRGRSVSACAGR